MLCKNDTLNPLTSNVKGTDSIVKGSYNALSFYDPPVLLLFTNIKR